MIVRGAVAVPGDKSITHRLLLAAALAPGTSEIRGGLTSLDARSSAGALRQLGATISPLRGGRVTVTGLGRFSAPTRPLYCGNSGTTARLLLGALAGQDLSATVTGDRSLRRRPMRRVTVPLGQMGATFDGPPEDGLPVTVRGGPLRSLRYDPPVSSAQVKGSLLFAGVVGGVAVDLGEKRGRSRDHTERLLRAFGYTVRQEDSRIAFAPDGRLEPFSAQVPGDVSSAAFLIGAALLAESGELRITGVGINPTRTGYLDILRRMGADLEVDPTGESLGEPVGDILVRSGPLRGIDVTAAEVAGAIDEIPMLAVLASRAAGTSVFREVGELRVKESDRLALLAENIRGLGGRADVDAASLAVTGPSGPPRGTVRTEADHRIAMAFAVVGTVPDARVVIDNTSCADVSFPGFLPTLRSLERRGRA